MSSSPYVKLGNRSLDQWKVTELKEELKRRKLTTKGLKEDLVKRLDEAVRTEMNNAEDNSDNDASQSELPSKEVKSESNVTGRAQEIKDTGIAVVENLDAKFDHEIDDHKRPVGEDKVVEPDLVQETKVSGLEGEQVAEFATVETTVMTSETTVVTTETNVVISETVEPVHIDGTNNDGDSTAAANNDGLPHTQEDAQLEPSSINTQSTQINKSSTPVELSSEPNLQGSENENEATNSTAQIETDDSKSAQLDTSVQPLKYQVSEADPDLGFQVRSDSVSTESVSINEKNELKVDVITDNVKLELDLKHEMAQQPSPSSTVQDGGVSHPMDVEEPLKKEDFDEPLDKKDVKELLAEKVPMEATGGSTGEDVNNEDSEDLAPAEKLSLDRSSGDDSMEEDIPESKQIEYKSDSNKISDNLEKSGMPVVKEDDDVDVVGHDKPVETEASNTENETLSVPTSIKRKFHGMSYTSMFSCIYVILQFSHLFLVTIYIELSGRFDDKLLQMWSEWEFRLLCTLYLFYPDWFFTYSCGSFLKCMSNYTSLLIYTLVWVKN